MGVRNLPTVGHAVESWIRFRAKMCSKRAIFYLTAVPLQLKSSFYHSRFSPEVEYLKVYRILPPTPFTIKGNLPSM